MSVRIDYSGGRFAVNKTEPVVTVAAPSGTYDEHYDKVLFLMKGTGSNGSNTITDETGNFTLSSTSSSYPEISTAQSKFGGSSVFFSGDAVGEELIMSGYSNSLGFGIDDFTIEFWLRWDGTGTSSQYIYDGGYQGQTGLYSEGFQIIRQDGSMQVKFRRRTETMESQPQFNANGTITANTWYHFAVVRDSTSMRIYRDGTLNAENTSYASVDLTEPHADVAIGRDMSGSAAMPFGRKMFTGWLDDFRITRGIARYTSNFTAPTATFPSNLASTTIDLSAGKFFNYSPSITSAIEFSNPPSSGEEGTYVLKVTPTAAVSLHFPSSVIWTNGIVPTAPSSGDVAVYIFTTNDGGVTYSASKAGGDMS